MSGIAENKKVNEITKEERKNLVNIIKNLKIDVKGLRPIEKDCNSRGRRYKEIDPSTMKSK